MVDGTYNVYINLQLTGATAASTHARMLGTDFKALGIATTGSVNSLRMYDTTLKGTKNITDQTSLSLQGAINSFTKFRVAMVTVMIVGAPLLLMFKAITKEAAELDKTIYQASAVTGSSVDSMREAILSLRKDTIFSASEIGKAFVEINKRGFMAAEAMEVLRSSTDLAVAGFTDLDTASSAITTVLNQFALSADKSGYIANVLATTANTTATSVENLSTALSYVGPIAATMGISIEEVNAAIGIMSDAGIDASMAGTGLRQILVKLMNPTKEVKDQMKSLGVELWDAKGNFIGLDATVRELSYALAGSGSMEEKAELLSNAFGARAGPAFAALLNEFEMGGKTIGATTEYIKNFGMSVEDMADKVEESVTLKIQKSLRSLTTDVLTAGDAWLAFKERVLSGLSGLLTYKALMSTIKDARKDEIITEEQYNEVMMKRNKILAEQPIKFLLVGAPAIKVATEEAAVDILAEIEEKNEKRLTMLMETKQLYDESKYILSSINSLSKDGIEFDETKIGHYQLMAEQGNILLEQAERLKRHGEDYTDILTEANKLLKESKEGMEEEVTIGRDNLKIKIQTTQWQNQILTFEEKIAGFMARELTTEEKRVIQIKQAANAMKEEVLAAIESKDARVGGWEEAIRLIKEIDDVAARLLKTEEDIAKVEEEITKGREAMKKYKDDLKSANDLLQKYMNQRFKGETALEKAMLEQERAINIQKLRLMELEDAAKSSGETLGMMKNEYDAWVESIDVAIAALAKTARDTNVDVTRLVQEFQTKRLGISLMKEDEKGTAERELTPEEIELEKMERAMERMRLEYDINYSYSHEKIGLAIQDWEDMKNGVADSVDSQIKKILAQKDHIFSLEEQISNLEKTELSLNKARDGIIEKMNAETEAFRLQMAAVEALNQELKQRAILGMASTVGPKSVSMYEQAFAKGGKAATVTGTMLEKYNSTTGQWETVYSTGSLAKPLATGGIIKSSTMAMLGEAGPEAVVPLSRGKAPISISFGDININGGGGNLNPRELQERFAEVVRQNLSALA